MSILHHIRHISFDAWNTLIIPNLEFSRARSELIAREYDIPFEQAKSAYTQTKRFLDTAAELTGFGTSVTNVYRLLNAQFKNKLDEEQLLVLRQDVNELFFAMPPTMPSELVEVLHQLKAAGYTMNILSNTNFVGGEQLRVIFDANLGSDFFDFAMFSDEHDMAKPHYDFFSSMRWTAGKLHEEQLLCGSVMHVGDNLITDVGGAESFGIDFIKPLLVSDPHDTARQFKEALSHA